MKKRSLILSVLALMLSLALFAVGTYALFSDQVDLKNHLYAGTLDITLTRTNLKSTTLDNKTGTLVHKEDPIDKDFTAPNEYNVFDIGENDLIVPQAGYTAEMKISNNSDVTFGYWLQIIYDDDYDLALADQMLVTVTTVDGTREAVLSEIVGLIGSEEKPIGVLEKTGSQFFTVSMKFLDLASVVNNAAESQSLEFDLIVHAVQIPES